MINWVKREAMIKSLQKNVTFKMEIRGINFEDGGLDPEIKARIERSDELRDE